MGEGDDAAVRALCARAPVIPVLVVSDPAVAAPLAKALVAGGLDVLEVTLRTPAALEAVRAMRQAAPQAAVGVGTVRTPQDLRDAAEAGAAFAVSPGATPRLLDASQEIGPPLLPGAATASEAMALAERGWRTLKFFPAEAAGGRPLLSALRGPLPDVAFCPTGGIGPDSAPDWLRLPNVLCVGGSWVAPADAVAAQDWARVERLAAEAAALAR